METNNILRPVDQSHGMTHRGNSTNWCQAALALVMSEPLTVVGEDRVGFNPKDMQSQMEGEISSRQRS
jgi:hypothetical protein